VRLICGGRLTVYARQFARLRGVVIDRRQAIAQRRGADAPVDAAVLNQPSETDELYSLAAGASLSCSTVRTRAVQTERGRPLTRRSTTTTTSTTGSQPLVLNQR